MKNTITVIALSSFLAVTACNKSKTEGAESKKAENRIPEKFIVDSVKVNDSVKITDSLKLSFTSKLLVFPTLKDKKLLDSIYFQNEKIKDFSKAGLQTYLNDEKNNYFVHYRKIKKMLPELETLIYLIFILSLNSAVKVPFRSSHDTGMVISPAAKAAIS